MTTNREDEGMAAQYAAEIRHENALKYADRVVASPETFHEDEVLLAVAVKTLRGRIKQWQDDYYRMNSMHEYEAARAEKAEASLLSAQETVERLTKEHDDTFTAPDGRIFSDLCAFNHWTMTRDFEARSREYTDAVNARNTALASAEAAGKREDVEQAFALIRQLHEHFKEGRHIHHTSRFAEMVTALVEANTLTPPPQSGTGRVVEPCWLCNGLEHVNEVCEYSIVSKKFPKDENRPNGCPIRTAKNGG